MEPPQPVIPTQPRSDAAVLRSVADGERDALEDLYRRHAPWLLLRLQRRCSDEGLVDEVLQDTFVAVWRGARSWDGRGEVAAWIWGIAVRRLIDALRRQPSWRARQMRQLEDLLDSDELRLSHAGGPENVVQSAEDLVLLGVEHGDLGAALRQLSPELRSVVQATVLDGLTTREAASLLGIPAGTVKTRMMRARSILRKELA